MSDDQTPLDPLRTIRGDGLPAAQPLPPRVRWWMGAAGALLILVVIGLMTANLNHRMKVQAAADQHLAAAQAELQASGAPSSSDAAAATLATSNNADALAAKQEHESHDAATTAAQAKAEAQAPQ